jgi:hypothetical protein
MEYVSLTSKEVKVKDCYHDDLFDKEITIKKFRFSDLFGDFRIFNGVHIATMDRLISCLANLMEEIFRVSKTGEIRRYDIIFVVFGSTSYNADYCEWPVATFSDRFEAERFAEKAIARAKEIRKIKERLSGSANFSWNVPEPSKYDPGIQMDLWPSEGGGTRYFYCEVPLISNDSIKKLEKSVKFEFEDGKWKREE